MVQHLRTPFTQLHADHALAGLFGKGQAVDEVGVVVAVQRLQQAFADHPAGMVLGAVLGGLLGVLHGLLETVELIVHGLAVDQVAVFLVEPLAELAGILAGLDFAADLALELRQVGLHAFIMGIGLLIGPFGEQVDLGMQVGLVADFFGHDFALDDLLGHHLRVEFFDFQERLRDQQLAFVVHPGFHGARQPLGLHILDSGVAPGVELLGDPDGVFDDDGGATGFAVVHQRCQRLA
ncbi:hypothetical protein D9M71_181890 [compost metagenome]